MSRVGVVSALVLCLAGSARAHDFWIEPSVFVAKAPATVSLGLRVGENLSGRGVRRRAEAIERFVAAGPQGEAVVPGLEGRDPAGFLRIDEPGSYVVGYETRGQTIELAAEVFEEYLGQEGLESVVEARRARGEADRPGREVFVRCAKSLVQAQGSEDAVDETLDRALGLTLELLWEPSAEPDGAGETARLRLLYLGEPVSKVLVVGRRRGAEGEPVQARTGDDGSVALPLSAGEWLFKAVHMVRAEQEPDADWKSFWASLTLSTR